MSSHSRPLGSALLGLLSLAPFAGVASGCASCAPPDVGAGGPLSGQIVINELMAANDTTIEDDFGEAEDWIELYNPGNEAVSLEGFRLSDDEDEPDRFVFPAGIELPAGGFLLVWADRQPTQGALHADFRLAREGEVVLLTDPAGAPVDRVVFGALDDDQSYGRLPDGEGEPRILDVPTPGAPNGSIAGDAGPVDAGTNDSGAPDAGDGGPPSVDVVINELLPAPASPIPDLEGDLVTLPWVELKNTGVVPVDVSDYYLSDDPADPTQSPIGGLAVLQPGDRFLVFGNSDPASGGLYHGTFTLDPTGGTLVFASPTGEVLERVDYGPLDVGMSLGRSPDGEGGFVAQAEPSPRAENVGPVEGDAGAPDAGLVEDAGLLEDAGLADGGAPDAG